MVYGTFVLIALSTIPLHRKEAQTAAVLLEQTTRQEKLNQELQSSLHTLRWTFSEQVDKTEELNSKLVKDHKGLESSLTEVLEQLTRLDDAGSALQLQAETTSLSMSEFMSQARLLASSPLPYPLDPSASLPTTSHTHTTHHHHGPP